MMMMMRDVLCNRTFLLFSTDRRKPLSLSLSLECFFMCFLLPDSRRIQTEEDQKNLSCQNAKKKFRGPPT
jgi:hypothetical protein